MSNPGQIPATEHTSVLLRRVLAEIPGVDVSIGYIVVRLRRRSFGGLFLFLALLGLIPGISLFAGVAMLIPAAQMAVGLRAPILPRCVRKRRIATSTIRSLGYKAVEWIEKIERFVKPRWLFLTYPPTPNVVGLLILGLAIVVMLPLPFSNFPPAVAIMCLSLGLLERDGFLTAIGLTVGAIALVIGGLIGLVAISSLRIFVENQLAWL